MFGLSSLASLGIGAAVVALFSFAGGLTLGVKVETGKLESYKAAQANEAVLEQAKAMGQIAEANKRADAAVAAGQVAEAARLASMETTRKAIVNAPKSQACVSSPAIRALLDNGVQPAAPSDYKAAASAKRTGIVTHVQRSTKPAKPASD